MSSSLRKTVVAACRIGIVSFVLVSFIVAIGQYKFGTVAGFVAFVNGSCLLVDRPGQTIGVVRPGQEVQVEYSLRNLSDRRVTVLGAQSSCTCARIEALPFSMAPRESATLRVTIKAPRNAPHFAGSISLFTDHPEQREVVLAYAGETARPEAPTAVDL